MPTGSDEQHSQPQHRTLVLSTALLYCQLHYTTHDSVSGDPPHRLAAEVNQQLVSTLHNRQNTTIVHSLKVPTQPTAWMPPCRALQLPGAALLPAACCGRHHTQQAPQLASRAASSCAQQGGGAAADPAGGYRAQLPSCCKEGAAASEGGRGGAKDGHHSWMVQHE